MLVYPHLQSLKSNRLHPPGDVYSIRSIYATSETLDSTRSGCSRGTFRKLNRAVFCSNLFAAMDIKAPGQHQEHELSAENKCDSSERRSDVDAELEPKVHLKTWIVVGAVSSVYAAQLLNVVGAGAYARDISSVVGGASETIWLATAIAILTVVLSPPVSQASDYWGRKWFLVILTFCGCIGSVIVSRATSMHMAIGGQVIAGFSYGAQPLLHAVPSEVLPRKWRPYAQGAANIGGAAGGITALLVGGALTRNGNHEGFRPYWYMTASVYFVCAVLVLFLYNPPPRPLQVSLTFSEKMKRLDWIGYGLLTVGLVLFCVGLSYAQNPYPWKDAHVLGPFLVGCAFATGLAIYEWKIKKDGMFHHELFSRGNNNNFAIALFCVFVEGLAFFAANNYFAFQMSILYETDTLRVTTRYSITFILFGLTALLAGWYCSTYKKIRLPTIGAFAFMVLFFILMATSGPGSGKAVWAFPVFLGIALGAVLCSLLVVAQLSTPPELIAITSGLMIGLRSLGGSVGLAIYNAIFNAKIKALGPNIAKAALPLGLPPKSLPQFIGALAGHNNTLLAATPGITPELIGAGVKALLNSFTVAFRYVWIAAGCFVVVALIASIFLVDPTSDFNSNIDAPVEKEEELFKH